MVRTAKRPNPSKRQVSLGESIPAPTGGWDAKNPLAAMPPQNAVILDNMIPRAGSVDFRRGFIEQVVGFSGPVESLMAYRGASTGDKLFAASSGAIYDASTLNAALGAALISGLTNNRWNYTSFANAAGEWLIACNGADTPLSYSGTAWATLSMNGAGPPTLNPKNLFNVFSHKGSLYYLEANSLRVWYPGAGAIQGALTVLDLSSIFNKGGRLVCGANWSWQFGVTSDDFAVFVTDQGQVAIYQGTNPASAAFWSLVGLYDFGPPLGAKALVKFGGDLAVLTTDGVIPLSQGLKLDRDQQQQTALTSNIMNAFSNAVKQYQSNYGWQGVLYPGSTPSPTNTSAVGGSLAIFNVPVTSLGTSVQFVQNVLTGAWCRFTDINAYCWEMANQLIYFGSTAGVFQWDVGSDDDGSAIIANVVTAFSDFGRPGQTKLFKMIRPLLNTNGLVTPALDVLTDYRTATPTAMPITVDVTQTGQSIRYDWTSCGADGVAGAAGMQINLQGDQLTFIGVQAAGPDWVGTGDGYDVVITPPFEVPCQLIKFDILYEPGGPL